MPEDHGIIRPFILANPRQPANRFAVIPDGFDDSIERGDAEEYVEGDLVYVTDGKVEKVTETTPADVSGLAIAGRAWFQPSAMRMTNPKTGNNPFRNLGEPLNLIDPDDEFVMTLEGTFNAAAHNAVLAGVEREIAYNTSGGFLTIRAGTTNPGVKMMFVHHGEVGDTNVRIACRFLPRVLRT